MWFQGGFGVKKVVFFKSRFLVTDSLCEVSAPFFASREKRRGKKLFLRMRISAKNRKNAIFCGFWRLKKAPKSGVFPVCRRKMRFCVFWG